MKQNSEAAINLLHLETELTRVDLLFHREVHRWQLAGQNIHDAFRGQYVSDDEARSLVKRPLATSWGQTVELDNNENRLYDRAMAQIDQQIREIIKTAHQQNHTLRLEKLAKDFDLTTFDLFTLLICLAPTLDLRYEKLCGYLQDDVTRKRPSVNLILDLLAEPGTQRLLRLSRFSPEAPLFRNNLLKLIGDKDIPLLSQTIAVDDTIIAWLLGNFQANGDAGSYAELIYAQKNNADNLLANNVEKDLTRIIEAEEKPLIMFYGIGITSQNAVARLLASSLNRPLLKANLAAVKSNALSPLDIIKLALRDARLTGAIPYITHLEVATARGSESSLLTGILNELCQFPDLVITAGLESWQPVGFERDRHIFWVNFSIPDYPQRLALWKHFLNSHNSPELDLINLSGQFQLTSGQIRDAVATAIDLAAQENTAINNEHLFTAARDHSSPGLSLLATKIPPRYDWQDIVLPHEQLSMLHELIGSVRGRPTVLNEWGFNRKLVSSSGVTALFSGPPGTGKTMAAGVIANELGLDLYKIDLSSVISKYIGETEKNLEKIFKEAEHSNAILFFDEADALFGKRSEVRDSHDRYANIEISYLLQRMEAYNGVTILATNLRANLDEAFTRRLQYVIDFPFPDETYRLKIWQTLFPVDVPSTKDLDFELLANRFKLTGGNIRNIIVSAAYLAADDGGFISMKHLMHGTRRELQKMGRLIPEADLNIPDKS